MSIKDMFAIARSYGDPVTNGLNQFKDYLSVENGINKNWQDALTFNQNVAAINAHNAQKAYEDQQRLLKQKGEFAALQQQAAHLYDPNTGQYRPEYQANQLAAREVYETGNPYARQANYNANRAALLTTADAIGAIDPAQATNLRNQALGGVGISARQAPDGTLTVRNSQGYAQTTANPYHAAMYGTDPAKTSATLASWQRDDQTSHRDFNEQLALNANSALLNRENNEHSLRLQAELRDAAKTNGATIANGTTPPVDMKLYVETRNTYFKELLDRGEDPQTAFNKAEMMANNLFGIGANAGTSNATAGSTDVGSVLTAHVKPKDAPSTTANNGQPAPAASLGSSVLAGTRWGSYQLPTPAETREAEIKQLNDYIAQMQAKWQENAQINPNSYLTQQQADAIRKAQAQLARVQQENNNQYFQRMNPLESTWNKIWYGEPNPQAMRK